MTTTTSQSPDRLGLFSVLAILLAELFAIQFARHAYGFECHLEQYAFCNVARNVLLASYSLAAVSILLVIFARDTWRDLIAEAAPRVRPLVLNLVGLGALFATLPFVRGDHSGASLAILAVVWFAAIVMVVSGSLLMLAPVARWRSFFKFYGWRLPAIMLAGIAAPFLAVAIRPFWSADALAAQTFKVTSWLLESWGQPVEVDPEKKIIGANNFYIDVAPSCSGVEGLMLTTLFAAIYLGLFKRVLRFPHAFLILPVALIASWLLNSLRIAVLVQLGISGHPELAIGGFHSHAGWLMFTLLSLGIVLVTQSLGLFRNKSMEAVAPAPVMPFFSDPVVAQILPFAVFMASGLLAQSFSVLPATLYPMRTIAMAVTLALFWKVYRAMPWRLDPMAVAVGLVVGVLWLVTAPGAEDGDAALSSALAAYSGAGLFFWIVCRVVGTTLLVPLVEELFFRGYLMQRIAGADKVIWRVILALVISSVFFGLLHDRWLAGGLAGLAFGLLMLRSNKLPDAVVAHAVANAVIAAAAVWYGDWSLI